MNNSSTYILLLYLNFATTIVLLIKNNILNIGLYNSSISITINIIHDNDILPLALPIFILVDFDNKYEGKLIFQVITVKGDDF